MPRISTFGEAVSAYRVYQLNAAGKIVKADWIDAASDGHAEAEAAKLCQPGTPAVEVWLGPRRIAVLRCPEDGKGRAPD